MQALFDLKNVSYTYAGKYNALDGINLKIDQGEHVAIMGANGSGKSTLLSILNCLIFPTSGELYVYGNLVEEDSFDALAQDEFSRFFRKKVGFIFQNPDVQMFTSTVYDEVAFGPLQLDFTHDDVKKRVEETLAFVGIEKLKERPPHSLSGGEKKKVCIASVLATNPDVLLLDEPTAGLDPRTQLWLIELLHELGEAGKTIITATHDLDIIEHISDRAVVMGEDHSIKVDGQTSGIVNDLELLLSTNLIHKHMHRHGIIVHHHIHKHNNDHMHKHSG